MSQTNVIAGALLAAFIVFITVRGKLNDYIGLFVVKRASEQTSSGDGSKDLFDSIFDKIVGDAKEWASNKVKSELGDVFKLENVFGQSDVRDI